MSLLERFQRVLAEVSAEEETYLRNALPGSITYIKEAATTPMVEDMLPPTFTKSEDFMPEIIIESKGDILYGRSPAQECLSDLRKLNEWHRKLIKQAEKPALNIRLLLAGGSIKNKRSLGAFRGQP